MQDERRASTGGTAFERRLATILMADIVGYSRMMEANEEHPLRIFRGHREIFDALLAQHRGRIFNSAGDAVLAEFPSAVEAVRCATEIQSALRTRNDLLATDERMQFRIGINLGDVIVQGADLLNRRPWYRLRRRRAPSRRCRQRHPHLPRRPPHPPLPRSSRPYPPPTWRIPTMAPIVGRACWERPGTGKAPACWTFDLAVERNRINASWIGGYGDGKPSQIRGRLTPAEVVRAIFEGFTVQGVPISGEVSRQATEGRMTLGACRT